MNKLKVCVAFVLIGIMGGCSALTDMVLQDAGTRSTQNENNTESNGAKSGLSNKDNEGESVVLPPQMVGLMFGVFYQIYFSWGGLFNHESLRSGEWAKYEFTETKKRQEKIYITKACLAKKKTGMNYLLKIESKKDWMKLDFNINSAFQLSSLRYSNSQGMNQEIENVSFALEAQNFNYQFPFKTMPRKTIMTSLGKQLTYEYKLGQTQEQYSIYLSPKVPGYLVLWEAENKGEKSRMQLIAYGKKADLEVK